MTSSPTPPPESSAAGNVAPTIPLQDPAQLPQQITTAMHSITDRLDILIAGMGQMFQLPLQALAYQLPQQAQPQLQAIPNQPTQPPPPRPTAPTAPVASTPPPATPRATSTTSTQVDPPHTSHRRSRSTTHRRHKSTRRSRTRSHKRRRSPRSQHRQRGPTARSDHHPSKTTSRSVRLIPNPRGSTPYDAFSEKTKERHPLSRPHRRQHRDMDVRQWREEEQPEEPSESATPAQSTQDYQNRAEAAQEANYRKQILKAKEDGRRCRAPCELREKDLPQLQGLPPRSHIQWFQGIIQQKTENHKNNQPTGFKKFAFDPALVEHTAAILGEVGLLKKIKEEDIFIGKLHQSGGKRKTTKYWAIGIALPEPKKPRPTFKHKNAASNGNYTYTWCHSTTNTGAARILAENLVRPSNWSYDEDTPPTDFPSYGFFGFGNGGSWSMQKAMDIAGNNCYKGKINCLQWIISGCIRCDDDRAVYESGGNWDLQIGCAHHGVAHNKKSKYWTFNSNHANIRALLKLQEHFDVPLDDTPDPPPSSPSPQAKDGDEPPDYSASDDQQDKAKDSGTK